RRDEGAAPARSLFCQRFLYAAQALTAFALDRLGERRKEAEIDVHRLVGARAGRSCAGGDFHVAAGDMREQCTMRRGWRRRREVTAQPLGGWQTARQKSYRRRI